VFTGYGRRTPEEKSASQASSPAATAPSISNVTITALGAFATYYVMTHPHLRRAVWRLVKYGVVTGMPGYLWNEVRTAWISTAADRRHTEIMAG
jgi:hypothetical protein